MLLLKGDRQGQDFALIEIGKPPHGSLSLMKTGH
jgi:hypothetical protein